MKHLFVGLTGIAAAMEIGVARGDSPPARLPDFGGEEASRTGPPAPTRRYTLAECLALADRNFGGLWAARARLALVHGQLAEAVWTPWWQWSATSSFGVAPSSQGTVVYPQSTQSSINVSGANTPLQPFISFAIGGTVPLYTFGKLEAASSAGEASVRASEWDMEKVRQQLHLDVRKAYFGVALARDAADFVSEAVAQLDRAIRALGDKLARGAPNVAEADKLRLEAYAQEIRSMALQAPKGDAYGLSALRFLTGVDVGFDILDAPLKRTDRPLASVVQYLSAARLFRPDVNYWRATVASRRASTAYARGRLFPDLGLALASNFTTAPGAPSQQNVWAQDAWNQFYYSASLNLKWGLDLLPQQARTAQAESSLEEARSLERLALTTATVEVERAYADAVEAKTREEAWDKAEHETKHWMLVVQDQVDLGTTEDGALLEPLRAFGNARVRHLYALLDCAMAESSLALASGWDSAAPSGL